jgi:hypothetical protein
MRRSDLEHLIRAAGAISGSKLASTEVEPQRRDLITAWIGSDCGSQ